VLRLSGNIEFRKVDIAFKIAGKLAELSVEEGADVQRGQMLARLERETMTRMRERDRAGVAIAESNLEQMRTAIEFQRRTLEAETKLREAELRQARAKLQELSDGARPQEIAQVRAQASDIRALQAQARRDWERAQKLAEAEDISQAQFDQFRLRLDSATAQLQNAEQRLALVVEGPRQTDLEAARANVARAEAALKLTEAQRIEIKRKQQDLVARRAEVERNQANVGVIDSQIADTTLTAPVDGVVLVRSADPGEVLAAGTPVLTLGEIDKPWFRGYVPQSKLGRVQLGQGVEVRSDSYPEKRYRGRITFIASEAEFTPKQIQTQEERVKLVYRIKVEVENPGRELKLSMPVDAEIRFQ
ncbi:MAG: HlyD family efflux transporter periplasmic adaptor subunit, partial [Acidobacteriota bacterium]